MGFASKGVWVMGYRGCMGYGALFPANQLGGLKKVWNLREYGVREPWVTRESTVVKLCKGPGAATHFIIPSKSRMQAKSKFQGLIAPKSQGFGAVCKHPF